MSQKTFLYLKKKVSVLKSSCLKGITLRFRVPTAQEKQGKWPKRFPVRENTGSLEFLSKQGIWFAQVVNSLVLKVKDISIFAAKIPQILFLFGYVCQVSFAYVVVINHENWHRENLRSDREKQGKHGNLKMQFEWVP